MKRSAVSLPQRKSVSSRAKKLLVLHGPNLNLLGSREPHIYGEETLKDIDRRISSRAKECGAQLECFQSNAEAELIAKIQRLISDPADFLIINPAAYTHTSVALRDALAAVRVPFIEVHLSNVHAREPFRRHSYFSDLAVGVICGLGSKGYDYALEFALTYVPRT
jgi:3-dehydroquinate dehydratase-2